MWCANRTAVEAANQRKKSFSSWLASQVKVGFKGGHALTKEPADGPHSLGPYEYVFYDNPDQMLVSKSTPWYTRWDRDRHEIHTDISYGTS